MWKTWVCVSQQKEKAEGNLDRLCSLFLCATQSDGHAQFYSLGSFFPLPPTHWVPTQMLSKIFSPFPQILSAPILHTFSRRKKVIWQEELSAEGGRGGGGGGTLFLFSLSPSWQKELSSQSVPAGGYDFRPLNVTSIGIRKIGIFRTR